MQKKYELTQETREVDGRTLYRIKALRDFGDVKAGDLGGFVEDEDNLDHEGDCWAADNACVFEYAQVGDDAIVSGNAQVSGYALVTGKAHVTGHAQVSGTAWLHWNAQVSSYADIYKDTVITGE